MPAAVGLHSSGTRCACTPRNAGLLQQLKQVGLGAAAAGTALSLWLAALSPDAALGVTNNQLLFLEAWRAVDRAYVDKTFNGQTWFRVREQYLKGETMDSREQAYAAVRKLLASLNDPFTRFLDPLQYSALRSGTKGAITGVGVEVTYDLKAAAGTNSDLIVVAPATGGPAEREGIQAGDTILAIDGRPTRGLSLYEAGSLLQGEEGSQVTLTVRTGNAAPRDLVMTREKVVNKPVSYDLCSSVSPSVAPSGPSGSLGYIRISSFNNQTVAGFQEALLKLQGEGAERYVLDLRNNGGGLFPAGVSVARSLLERGDVVLIADSDGIRDIYSADGTAIEPTAPLSVLVNKGTASASEVLAGALKDDKRATIVGEPTFGKGLIQTVVELSDGSGVAITVAKYQTPAGVDINKVGILPDLPLAPGQLPPKTFCSAVQAKDAPRLFQ